MQVNQLAVDRSQHLVLGAKYFPLSFLTGALLGQIVAADDHVLGRNGDRPSGRREQQIVGGKHQYLGFQLSFEGERDVHCHLVPVEVGVKSGADQGV